MALGLLTWDRLYLSRMFDLAGHLSRVMHNDPCRLTSRVLMWMSLKRLYNQARLTGHSSPFMRISRRIIWTGWRPPEVRNASTNTKPRS